MSVQTETAELPKSTRDRLLDVAERLFAERGFYGTSIGALATALEVAKASVMHHFKSKEALYEAVMARNAQALGAAVDDALAHAGDPRERARRLIGAVLRWGQDRPEHTKLVVRDLLDAASVDSSGRGQFGPVIGRLLAEIKAAQQAGSIRPGPTVPVLELIMGVGAFHVVSRPAQREILGGERAQALDAEFTEHMQALLEQALLTDGAGTADARATVN
jgi:AcrR family transcriptional regulator